MFNDPRSTSLTLSKQLHSLTPFSLRSIFNTPSQPRLLMQVISPAHTQHIFSLLRSFATMSTNVYPCNGDMKSEEVRKHLSFREHLAFSPDWYFSTQPCQLAHGGCYSSVPSFFRTKSWSPHSQILWEVCMSKMWVRISRHGSLSHRFLEKDTHTHIHKTHCWT